MNIKIMYGLGIMSMILFSCSTESNVSNENDAANKSDVLQKSKSQTVQFTSDYCSKDKFGSDVILGKPISAQEAIDDIRAYEKVYAPKDDSIMGYLIKLDHLKMMLAEVDAFNTEFPDSIIGLRFYNSLNTRKLSRSANAKQYDDLKDLVVVPTYSNGNDVEEIYMDKALNFTLFSYFRPCPRLCTDKKSLHKKNRNN